MGNAKKSEQLGMPFGTATQRLRKQVMFRLIQKCGMDSCHQCGEKINSVEDLSVEHKIPWLNSNDPTGLFFDVNNIAFSHLSCNIASARNGKGKEGKPISCPSVQAYWRGCRCDGCTQASRTYHKSRRKRKL